MSTLLIPLVGPIQSWSVDARFGERLTLQEPSKSGVIGLLCAALGRDRKEPIGDLVSMPFGVRVDRPGVLLRDYHTALEVASAGTTSRDTVLSNRWYLSDAAFLVGFQGDAEFLGRLHNALKHPVWPVFLGRKACLPALPLAMPDAVVDAPLIDALRAASPLPSAELSQAFRLVIDDPKGPQSRPDQPTGPFAQRQFSLRRVRTDVFAWNLPASS
ncbi:MAG: type I-E CRISPR-associated protein Cas5/CasD [Burkholderiales bacterium]|nr:type I-E CRISPR-associated protein Cas5/CasD [Burkholderiales bacterium]